MEVSTRLGSYTTCRLSDDAPMAFDDPVPADSGVFRDVSPSRAHSVERQVQRKLLAHPSLRFSSLVVRRMPDGICLEGVLSANSGADVCSLARQVEGVGRVLNHLLVHAGGGRPAAVAKPR